MTAITALRYGGKESRMVEIVEVTAIASAPKGNAAGSLAASLRWG
jgi:hypothetical protein